nr:MULTISPECIES: DUF2391 family protein [Haloarcula]
METDRRQRNFGPVETRVTAVNRPAVTGRGSCRTVLDREAFVLTARQPRMVRRRYRVADTAQQLVGGFLLAGPFVVTEEVWVLAENMSWYHAVVVVGIVFAIGYGALYKADAGRDIDTEAEVAGIPVRFVSLMIVAFGSVAILATALTAPDTFLVDGGILADPTPMAVTLTTLKAIIVGAIFSVVGAATADSVF